MAIAPAMRNDFPELEEVSQVWYQESGLVTVNQKKINEKRYAFADDYFTSLFDYTWLEGNYKTTLSAPNTIVLIKSLAHKYFGTRQAMNQIIHLDNEQDVKVTGVIKDLPGNTHPPFNFLVSFETIRKRREEKGAMSTLYWISNGSFCYIVTPNKLPANIACGTDVPYKLNSFQKRSQWIHQVAGSGRQHFIPGAWTGMKIR